MIAARRTKLALQVLEQLDLSDRVLRSIVNVYEMANQPEAAILELKELLQRHPDDVNVVQRLAEIAVTQRDYAAGSAYYQTLHDLDPSNKHVAMKLAETLLMLARQKDAAGESDKAITLFDESFRIQTPDAKLKREYGGMLANQGQFEQAIGLLEKLHDTASRLQLAAILEMEGSVDRALQVLLDLEKTGELNDKARHSVARLLLANKKHAEAAERLVVLLEKNPDDPRLQRELIDAVAASDRWSNQVRQTTMNIYQQYHTNDFQGLDVQGFARLGDALRRLEFYTQANITLKKAVTEFPESRRLRFYLAQTLSNLGRYDDAETQYKILLNTRPTSAR